MIHAVFRRQNGKFCACSVQGHADYADDGQDVVCAAVSSAIQLTANLITENFQENASVSVEEVQDHNQIRISLGQDSPSGQIILEGLLTHLQSISEEFPDHIKINLN
ncbi:MAG: ribosomal-processing cysteine protease Prp [Oscillospiraceae bacterium]|nr:ribosomal-processing cysteine protease Prp [Oscillospiraceae bacterium]